MKKVLLISLVSAFCLNLWAATERNLLAKNKSHEIISGYVLPQQEWVPYPAYADRVGWDKLTGKNKQMLIRRGEKQLAYEWKVVKATDYLEYERSGDRNVMQNPNSANNNALADLVMAELAEGKGRFIDQVINGVFYNCERTSWVLSAHLPAQLSGRSFPEESDTVIDLGSGETGAFLAWTYYFFHREFDKVNPEISKRLRNEIYRKILLPYRNTDRYWWMAFQPRADKLVNNWNPWCNFNVLQCALLIENDPQQLSKDIYRSMLSVDKFINYVNEDGACEEGPSYWEHAAGKLYDYLQLLYLATNGKVSLFGHPMIKNMGEYISRSYVGNGWVVNFADASARFSTNPALIYRYGKAIGSQEMMQFAAYLSADSDNTITFGSDIFRTLQSVYYDAELRQTQPAHRPSEVTVYPQTQFYYFKTKQNFFLAAKGGYNAESHNHNDVGTFSLWVDDTPVLIDAGVGTYTRQTFGPERYSIWTMRSNYHNIPCVNGVEQKFGKEFKAKDLLLDAKKKVLSMDIAAAYPSTAGILRWIRSYQLKDNELVVRDNFNLKKCDKSNEIHFMLWGRIEVKPGKVLIDIQDKKMELLYDSKQFVATLDTITLPDIRLSKVWGKEIFRLTLKAQQMNTAGNYEFRIRRGK